MSQTIALPTLDSRYPVTTEQQASFQKNGHILLSGILTAEEVAAYREVIVDAADRYNTEKRKMEERDTYGKAFLQIMNLWEVDENVRKYTLAKRFAQIAADLMGVEQVRLYHDQALFKEPGGGLTPWHQDQYYWPIDTTNTVTMWMPLVDISVEMGMLTFASGSQELGFLGNLAISDDSEAILGNLVTEKGYPISRPATMKAGDATFHAGWTLHSAPGNQSPNMREVMTVIYMADGAKVTEPKNKNQEADRQRWLMSKAVGTLIDSPLNPVL
ncbi:MAG TPA: phytanoyl-CoA dioxygenase family protein [Haliscomenobacter sp.]|uniref:phytanoyl-CoA dioxygenase family protein n=1 Tax=Haliscomenobacter sp. TaxID=2717303 RepID=UPI002C421D2B|nr:phytanoyl-CoA dioxygenase family protein [Haliscomenobacter sp.]HOY18222.1 phytanoyl-CoA dioxygenase family protein [Haliscomenobacter sp.]